MNVAELITQLQMIPDPAKTIVVQSIDSEGNSIRNTAEFSAGDEFEQDSSWDGELKLGGELTEERKAVGYDVEDMATDSSVPCICFWPVN